MRRKLCLVLMLVVVFSLSGASHAAPRRSRGWGRRSPTPFGRSGRGSIHGRKFGWSHRRARRRTGHTAAVSLPQLRTELTRLETGLGAHVQRIEQKVSHPAVPRPVVIAAPAARPVERAPGLPAGPAAAGAVGLSLLAGGIGFMAGRWAGRPARA